MTKFNKLVEKLISDNYEESTTARSQLYELIEEKYQIFKVLINALNNGDSRIRMEILNFLEYIPDPGINSAIEHVLHLETDSPVKQQAIRTMKSRMCNTSALLLLCDDDNVQVRAKALEALNPHSNLSDTVNVYEKALQDNDSENRLTAAYALLDIKEVEQKFPTIKPLVRDIEKTEIDDQFWDEFYEVLSSVTNIYPDNEEVYDLGELKMLFTIIHELRQDRQDSAVVKLLIKYLDNTAPRIRLAVVIELTKTYPEFDLDEGEVIVSAFIKLLSDPEAPIRGQAVSGLFETSGSVTSARIQEALTPLLEDPDNTVRKEAKWVLNNID